ncbi:MAG: TolC family protein [Acidobacteriales bacterium]|nr:TolC family protein [Terriglobales bacterium]
MKPMLLAILTGWGCLWAQQSAAPTALHTAAVTVDQAVEEALAKNLSLAAERYNISIAEARQITARLRPNPVFTLDGDHLDLLGTGFDTINNGGPNEYSVRTDFILERGGKRAARMAVAAADTSVAGLNFRDAMRRLVYDVESAFVDVQLAKEALALTQANLNSFNEIVQVNTVRVKSGDLAPVELDRSQVAALQARAAVRQAGLQLTQAINRLQVLMGRPAPSKDFDVTGPFRKDSRTLALADLQRTALANRPDLLSLRQTIARNQADLRLQIAQSKPDFTVGSEYRRQQAPSATANTLGLFFSVPLAVFNRNQGEIARAQREEAQTTARLRAQEAGVSAEVVGAWEQYTTARALVDSIEAEMLTKASNVRETTSYSYRRGEATFVELLDAQRAFNDTMQGYNEARANYARSLYLMDSVSGGTPEAGATGSNPRRENSHE